MKLPIILTCLILATATSKAMPALEGTVKDTSGHPLAGAEIRLALPADGSIVRVTRTDGSGRYHAADIRADVYQVSLVLNSDVKASIKNVKIELTDPTQLNFELKAGKVVPQAKGKHFVWQPSHTGTNLAGRWIEVDEKGRASAADSERITRGNGGEIIRRIQENSGASRTSQ